MTERRHLPRVQMRCSVSLWKSADGTVTHTTTENLTSRGFFCLSGEPYLPGDELHATLEVPAEYCNGLTTGHLILQCQVEVVRIQGEQSGLGCRIKDYTVLPEPPSISEISD